MFFVLSKTLDVLLSPLTWAIGLALVGLYRDRRGRLRWAPAGAAAVLLLFSLPPVANGLVRHLEGKVASSMKRDVTYDAVVLLGGAVDHAATAAWGQPAYNDNVERLLVTYDLLRAGRARHAILTGGRGYAGDPVVEARALGKQLEDWGIPASKLVLEDRARNTRENAVLTRRIVEERGFRSVLVVTSAFHMARSLDAFRAVDLAVDVHPVDYRSASPERARGSWLPRAGSLAESTQALRELFGGLVYRVVF